MRVYREVATEKTVLCSPALAPPALCSGNDLRGMRGPGRASSLRWLCCQSCSGCGEQVTAIRGLPAGQLRLQGLPGLVPLVPVGLVSLAWGCHPLTVRKSCCTWKMEDGASLTPLESSVGCAGFCVCLGTADKTLAAFGANDSCPSSRCGRSSWPPLGFREGSGVSSVSSGVGSPCAESESVVR